MSESIEELKEQIKNCNKCKLCKSRNNIVLGAGDVNTKVMFIGEGPGADEDKEGLPFVGKAGKLMDFSFEPVQVGFECRLNHTKKNCLD